MAFVICTAIFLIGLFVFCCGEYSLLSVEREFIPVAILVTVFGAVLTMAAWMAYLPIVFF